MHWVWPTELAANAADRVSAAKHITTGSSKEN